LNYEGTTEITGSAFNVEAAEEGPKPFKALLDVGLARTTSGAKIFGVLKGSTDGGLNVPHNDHRFPGSKRENGEWTTDPDTHRKYIFGGHVAEWMKKLQEDDEEAYNRQFSRFVKKGITHDKLEALYTKVHAAIRADPTKKRDDKVLGYFGVRKTPKAKEVETKNWRSRTKISRSQRKNRVAQKLRAAAKAAGITEH